MNSLTAYRSSSIGCGTKIKITEEVYRQYKQSIALNPPETFALLGGDLNDGLTITHFYFLPPMKDSEGKFVSSGSFVYPDHDQLNYIIDNVLVRNGLYMLGLWHSHPSGVRQPSSIDLSYCSRIIANDDSPGLRWKTFLAPITTFDQCGCDRIDMWVLQKHGKYFLPASYEVLSFEGSTTLKDDLPIMSCVATADRDELSVISDAAELTAKLSRVIVSGKLDPLSAHKCRNALQSLHQRIDSCLSRSMS